MEKRYNDRKNIIYDINDLSYVCNALSQINDELKENIKSAKKVSFDEMFGMIRRYKEKYEKWQGKLEEFEVDEDFALKVETMGLMINICEDLEQEIRETLGVKKEM